MPDIESTPAMGSEKYYFDQLAQGVFKIQRCTSCEKAVFYPRMVCPHCGSGSLGWIEPSGKGTVYSSTTVRRKPEHGGAYNVSLIDLEEGVRMMSRVEGIDPDDVRIGMAVQAKVIDDKEGKLVVFNKAQA